MSKIKILNEEYSVLDELTKISIADSFVLPQNKIRGGNGEAKLYVGHAGPKIIEFFGHRGFEVECFLSRQNILSYLDNAYSEYIEPQQPYRHKDELPKRWEERRSKVLELNDVIEFRLNDQDQIIGPRVYVNSDDEAYTLIREICLPVISYINVYRLQKTKGKNTRYYFKLFFNNAEEEDPEAEIPVNLNTSDGRFNPVTDEDVENELSDTDKSVDIDTPFNPNKIKVRTTPSSIGQIIDDLKDKIINLDTEFQRLPNLWDVKKKSRFIESLLLRLPIPAFYFNEKEENNLEVVDGLQRTSTIKSFVIDKNFVLKDLEFLKEFNGCSFETLPSTLSRRIKTFPITTYIIEKGTPDEVKFNIFKRVNTGGLILTAQEIRHAINQGAPSKLVADLVRGENIERADLILKATKEGLAFVQATDSKIGSFRMEDRDFATRFVSFYLIPYHEYKPDLDTFLNNGMAKVKELSPSEISTLKNDFFRSMSLAYDVFGNDAFRKRFDKIDSRKPINKALFEVLSVSFSRLSDSESKILKKKRSTFINKFINLHNDFIFLRSITQGTAQRDNVLKRFTEIEKIIKETLGND